MREGQWKPPDLMEERGELIRQAGDLGVDWIELLEDFRNGKMSVLEDSIWDRMENTDSNSPNLTLEELMSWEHRDAGRILRGLEDAEILPAPMILVYRGTPICVGGNTRLSACRLMGIRPQVLMAFKEQE